MYPELFKIGPISIRAYGVMLTISFLLGVIYVYKMSKKKNIPFDPLLTLAYIMIFGGVFGARLFYVLFHLDEFKNDWLSSINPFHSGQFGIAGLNLYGGVVVAVILSFLYIRVKRLPLFATLDLFAPTVGLGLIFTRVGCFLNGCCFGTPTNLPWGVSFPVGSIPYYIFGTEHLHPAQLYSSLYGLLLFLVLHWRLKHKIFDGQAVGLYFMIEAVFRYLIEYVRYYETEMHFSFFGMEPTYNQLISILLFLLGMTIYIWQYRRYHLTQTRLATP
ncbi:Prolipoprotein diacylglyceryl transferase [Candidatus Zixiibacteriota bacterium]|nr:Prolipoprotein diacylglyceryl transferase [candidate division Zixibacteria bacterium]